MLRGKGTVRIPNDVEITYNGPLHVVLVAGQPYMIEKSTGRISRIEDDGVLSFVGTVATQVTSAIGADRTLGVITGSGPAYVYTRYKVGERLEEDSTQSFDVSRIEDTVGPQSPTLLADGLVLGTTILLPLNDDLQTGIDRIAAKLGQTDFESWEEFFEPYRYTGTVIDGTLCYREQVADGIVELGVMQCGGADRFRVQVPAVDGDRVFSRVVEASDTGVVVLYTNTEQTGRIQESILHRYSTSGTVTGKQEFVNEEPVAVYRREDAYGAVLAQPDGMIRMSGELFE